MNEDTTNLEFEEKMRLVRSKLINKSKVRLFGLQMFRYNIYYVEDEDTTAGVFIDGSRPGMVINKNFFKDMNVDQCTYVIMHEMMHVLYGHPSKKHMSGSSHAIMNIAQDHVINSNLNNDVDEGRLNDIIQSPHADPDDNIVKELKGYNLTAQEVYDWLMENAEVEEEYVYSLGEESQESSSDGQEGDGQGEGEGEESEDGEGQGQGEGDGEGQGEGQGEGEGESEADSDQSGQSKGSGQSSKGNAPGNIQGRKMKITTPGGQTKETDIVEKKPGSAADLNDPNQSKKVSEEIASNLRNAQQSGMSRGLEESNIGQVINELIEVEVPWDQLLEQAIKSIPVPSDNRSWKQPHKLYRHHGLMIPAYDTEQVAQALYLVEDTSASVSEEDLKRFADVVEQAFTHFSYVVEFQHDVYCQAIKRHDRQDFMRSKGNGFEFQGRGGTSHNDVFDKVEEYFYEHDEEASLLIVLTDYMSDLEQVIGNYDWPKEVPMKVVLVGNGPEIVSEHIDPHPIVIDKNKD